MFHYLSYRQAHLPRNSPAYSRPDSPTSIAINKYSIYMSTRRRQFLIWGSLSPDVTNWQLQFAITIMSKLSRPFWTTTGKTVNYSTGRIEKDWLLHLWSLRSKGIFPLTFFILHWKRFKSLMLQNHDHQSPTSCLEQKIVIILGSSESSISPKHLRKVLRPLAWVSGSRINK